MQKHVPNILTGLRLVLAGVFFAMLSRYQFERPGDPTFLNIAFLIYLVALITDFFDGYFARKWKAGSAFGRITDPLVDKVLVLGSFIFFAGKNFVIPSLNPEEIPHNVKTITGVVPWMVVLLLTRELLVTSFRGVAESRGQQFGAQFSGKVKMTLQSITILVILAYVNFRGHLLDYDGRHHANLHLIAERIRDVFIWATLVITVYSGFAYVRRIIDTYRQP
jgi:CDP-diacylglycerol--glycerol-3-phosphate 3-phosphatidyltransferase